MLKKNGKKKELSLNINYYLRNYILPFMISFFSVIVIFFGFKNFWPNKKISKPVQPVIIQVNKSQQRDLVTSLAGTYLDPYDLIVMIKKKSNDFTLLDLRTKNEYQKEHIKGAIFFPQKSVNLDKKKTLILYGPTAYSAITGNNALELINQGYSVKILSVGWNEFRHFRNLWLPESQWEKIDVGEYVENNNQ